MARAMVRDRFGKIVNAGAVSKPACLPMSTHGRKTGNVELNDANPPRVDGHGSASHRAPRRGWLGTQYIKSRTQQGAHHEQADADKAKPLAAQRGHVQRSEAVQHHHREQHLRRGSRYA